MTLQLIRTAYETPVRNALLALTPAIASLTDNQFYDDNTAVTEFALIRINFGLMTEAVLCAPMERIRGSLVVEIFTQKGKGPGRAQIAATAVLTALAQFNAHGPKPASGVYARLGAIDGPTFTPLDGRPHLATRITCPIRARVEAPDPPPPPPTP